MELHWFQGLLCIEVDKAPVLQEAMESQDTADVASELLATLSAAQVGRRVLSIQLDDVVALLHEGQWVLVAVFAAKVLWQGLHFEFMDFVELEPSSGAWQH